MENIKARKMVEPSHIQIETINGVLCTLCYVHNKPMGTP